MAKLSAFGTVIRMGRGNTIPGPETFDTVANVTGISGPGLALDSEDVTTHDSGSAWEEVVATVLRSGEITIDIAYDPRDATHDAISGLVDKLDSKQRVNFRIIFPGNTEWIFSAFVTGFEPDAPVDGALTAAVTLKLSGAPTLV